jgi:hypothetical protein
MGPPSEGAIFQTGQIPAGSQSIRFYGGGARQFSLAFFSQNIPLTAVASGPNYTIFGGDVSMFAGQTGQLLFEGNGLLDNIVFSPTAILEPSVLGMFAAGAVLLAWRSVRRSRAKDKPTCPPLCVRNILIASLWASTGVYAVVAQTSFQNLNFESGTLVPIPGDPYDRVLFSAAFPGWAGSAALYNSTFLDSSGVSIIDPGWSASLGSFGISGPIEGNFTAILQAGVVGDITNPQDTSLSQTGLIPLNTKTLLFKAFFPGTGPNLAISLGGQPLSYSLISSGMDYGEYAADITNGRGRRPN